MHVYQFIFLGRGSIAFTRFSMRKCVPLCHSHTPRLGPSCPHSHEYRQTSAADQPEHVLGGVCAVRVRLQIHGSWRQNMQEPQYLPIELGTEGQRPPPPQDGGSPITFSQLEMNCSVSPTSSHLGEPRRQGLLLHPQPALTRNHR